MLLLLSVLSASAQSSAAREAEHVRLSESMRRLAGRNAWDGVDRGYRDLQALNIPLTYDDHYLGAQAAWALGDAEGTRARLERAMALRDDAEVRRWLAEIHSSYSSVQLTGAGPLQIAEAPFAADQRAALGYASARLAADGAFTGMLPNGQYTFGEHAFELFPGCPAVVVGQKAREVRAVPLRAAASLGIAITRAGTPGSRDLQPGGFGGPGPRLGIGPEVSLGDALGLKAEVGYQGLLSGDSRLHLGYVWLAGSWTLSDGDGLTLAAGPGAGLGVGRTVGLDRPSYEAFCADHPDDLRCGWVDLSALDEVVFTGAVRTAGLTGSAAIPGRALGRFHSGLALLGGVQTDTHRLYPWAQLALTLEGD
jgi:hypothetical protein